MRFNKSICPAISQYLVLNPIALTTHHPAFASKMAKAPPINIPSTPSVPIDSGTGIISSISMRYATAPPNMARSPATSLNALPLESMLHSKPMVHTVRIQI